VCVSVCVFIDQGESPTHPAPTPPPFTLVQRPLLQQSETEYTILTTTELDREVTSRLNVTLSCTDGGAPAQRSTKYILVCTLYSYYCTLYNVQ